VICRSSRTQAAAHGQRLMMLPRRKQAGSPGEGTAKRQRLAAGTSGQPTAIGNWPEGGKGGRGGGRKSHPGAAAVKLTMPW